MADLDARAAQLAEAYSAAFGGDAVVATVALSSGASSSARPASARRSASLAPVTKAIGDHVPLFTCYTDMATCVNATNNCTSQGACYESTLDTAPCFYCKCNANIAGEQCQYYDISSIFWIMVFVAVFLIVSAIITSGVLASIDPGPSTVLFKTASSGRAKNE